MKTIWDVHSRNLCPVFQKYTRRKMSWDPESIKEKIAATWFPPPLNILFRHILYAINPCSNAQSGGLILVAPVSHCPVKTVPLHQPQSSPRHPALQPLPVLHTLLSNFGCCLSLKDSLHFQESCVTRNIQVYSYLSGFSLLIELLWDISTLLCVFVLYW